MFKSTSFIFYRCGDLSCEYFLPGCQGDTKMGKAKMFSNLKCKLENYRITEFMPRLVVTNLGSGLQLRYIISLLIVEEFEEFH